MAATGPDGTSLTRSDSSSEARNAERCPRVQGLTDREPQRLARLGDATAEHDHLGVDAEREQVDGLRQPVGEVVPAAAARVAGDDGRVQGQGRRGFVGRPRRGERRAGGDGLQAAALAARAQQSGRVDRDVADLPRDTAGAATQPTVDDDAGGETGADAEVGQVAGAGQRRRRRGRRR